VVVNKKIKQKGFTLIELMIAMMLGLIVIGGALSIYISTIKSSSDVVKSARLNYDLDSAMQFMINDIRRAGYWGGAVAESNAAINPFSMDSTNTNITIPTASCILYSYDYDGNGADEDPENLGFDKVGNAIVVVAGGTSEFFGFKLEGGDIKVWSKTIADTTGNCSADGWIRITDENKVNVSSLSFSNTNSQCLNRTPEPDEFYAGPCSAAYSAAVGVMGKLSDGDQAVEVRQIDITLTGNVVNDDPVEKTLTATVKVRNNRIFTQ